MSQTSSSGETRARSVQTLDVRSTAPAERHPRIFGAYEQLSPGESFVLINDHDPKPLFYQFQAEHAGAFTWEYLERGPRDWRVRIGRPPCARVLVRLTVLPG